MQPISTPLQLATLFLALVAPAISLTPAHAETRFRMVEDTGVDAILPFEQDDPRAYLYYTGHAGGAICLGDVNGDQRPDLYLSRGLGQNVLYLNQGDWKFRRQRGPFEQGSAWGTGAVLVDIDADGDLDICQVNYDAPVQFFRNDGFARFTETTNAFGIDVTDAALSISFADADNDGDLDAFLLCNTYFRPEGRPVEPPFEIVDGKPVTKPAFSKHYRPIREHGTGKWVLDEYGRRDYFFLNVGTKTHPKFRDVSEQTGACDFGFGLSCVWWDYDNDGRMDLSVSNDFLSPDRLYRNLGTVDGIPRFRDMMGVVTPTSAWSSMGSGVTDVNNDGRPDLLTVDMSARSHFKSKLNMGEMAGERRWVMTYGWPRQIMRNHLYVNAGLGHFREEAWMRGLASTDWSWAVKWADFDCDGWSDVLVTNGMTRNFTDSDHHIKLGKLNEALVGKSQWDLFRDQPPMLEENVVYANQQGKRFEEVGAAWGLNLLGISYGAASGDLDGDGDPDLVVTHLGNAPKLYENRTPPASRSFQVILEGTAANRMGVGAKVTVEDDQGVRRTRWMMPWTGFQSQDEPVLHFGLGEAAPVAVEVAWPGSSQRQRMRVPNLSSMLITQAKPNQEKAGAQGNETRQESPWWAARELPWKHRDPEFDDFALQPLLPGKLSQDGPCLAAGDLNADGRRDYYLGGAAGRPGSFLVNFEGRLRVGKADWGAANACEDVAALWFDADGDGDLDLYVVSGSNEFASGDERYRDRLYRNDTQGGQIAIEAQADALPDLRDSGSCVVAADFDDDGDLDLFVGTRSLPGQYPLSGPSRLLRNESTEGNIRFVDVTQELAPALADAGLVTDASWADFDADGDPDLIVSVEWGPIRIYENLRGKLQELGAPELAARTGWWQTVATGDFDGDGDVDILAGNVGWNTKYGRPSNKKPAEIYYGDMNATGIKRIIEAKTSQGDLLPVRGRSCSSHAIPGLASKFETYREFALSDLQGIYGQQCLDSAQRFAAVELASGMWRNQGDGKFEWLELPWNVQASQVNDFAVGDIDGDGHVEVVVAQNEDAREPETSLWRGGLGVVLQWRAGGWREVPTANTGMLLSRCVRGIELVDLDEDGRLELLAVQHNGPLLLLASPDAAKE